MAGFMLEHHALALQLDLRLTTAGTHAIEGMPISWRTSEALAQVDLLPDTMNVRRHRSRQLEEEHLDQADLVIGMEADHVRWVRRFRPQSAGITGTLKRLCRDLPSDARPLDERVRSMDLDDVELESWEDVVDPAGRDLDVYVERAHEIWKLTGELIEKLR